MTSEKKGTAKKSLENAGNGVKTRDCRSLSKAWMKQLASDIEKNQHASNRISGANSSYTK